MNRGCQAAATRSGEASSRRARALASHLDQVKPGFPDDHSREDGALMAARAARWGKASPLNGYLRAAYPTMDVIAQLERDEMAILLQACRGNVAAVARELGVCRDTVYDRADRLALNIDAFRPRRPRRLRRA